MCAVGCPLISANSNTSKKEKQGKRVKSAF